MEEQSNRKEVDLNSGQLDARQLHELKNPVKNCKYGCGMKGRENARKRHEDSHCPLRPIPCEMCGEPIPKRHILVHQRNSCGEREVKCHMCRQPIKAKDVDEHYVLCRPETPAEEKMRRLAEKAQKEGPNKCEICDEIVPIDFEDRHLASSCRILLCLLCNHQILKMDRHKHAARECPEAEVSCARCDRFVRRRRLLAHQERECARRLLRCGACGDVVPAEDLEGGGAGRHAREECGALPAGCPRGCGAAGLRRADLEEHLKSECIHREHICEGCKNPVMFKILPAHMTGCTALNEYWEGAVRRLGAAHSRAQLQRRLRRLLEAWASPGAAPQVALLALAAAGGEVQPAAERLRGRPAYADHLRLICEACDVNRFVSSKKTNANKKQIRATASEPAVMKGSQMNNNHNNSPSSTSRKQPYQSDADGNRRRTTRGDSIGTHSTTAGEEDGSVAVVETVHEVEGIMGGDRICVALGGDDRPDSSNSTTDNNSNSNNNNKSNIW